MNDIELRHAETDDDLRACFAVMQELRPNLQNDADFLQRIARMRGESYQLLAVWQAGKPIALAGYRHQENLIHGRFLYVDDLIVTEKSRSSRWGARLLDEMEAIARSTACQRLVLDTGLANALAQRFYFRWGLLTSAIRFGKPLAEGS